MRSQPREKTKTSLRPPKRLLAPAKAAIARSGDDLTPFFFFTDPLPVAFHASAKSNRSRKNLSYGKVIPLCNAIVEVLQGRRLLELGTTPPTLNFLFGVFQKRGHQHEEEVEPHR